MAATMPDEATVFNAAREIEDLAARRQYVAQACGEDRALAGRVEALLRMHDEDSIFLASPTEDMRALLGTPVSEGPSSQAYPSPPIGLPCAGQTLGDFHLERLLGAGSFGKVFLARQISLARLVALKVSINRGHEARTLAGLEHDHIVRVFSEVVDPARDLRMLCMQYVPGTTLEHIIENLARCNEGGTEEPAKRASGRNILDVVDAYASDPASLDLAALRDRELLAGLDFIEAGCWMGARLAEALAHAHRLGVLHRDVKPANILVNRYGRPLLVDFNVSCTIRPDGNSNDPLGGTLAYMSPEHLEAIHRFAPSGHAVDARADIYSLGVVLFELFTGGQPFPRMEHPSGDLVQGLIEQRSAGPPPMPEHLGAPPALRRVIARCLAPRSDDRFRDAVELADALESCRQLRRAERDLPCGGVVTRMALARPFLVAAVLMPLPQVLGSVVNITYNTLRIGQSLDEGQTAAFLHVLLVYNSIVYPFGLFLFFRQVVPVFRTWKKLAHPEPADAGEVACARRRALKLPLWAIALSCLGWLPGGILFPLAIHLQTAKPPPYFEFIFSFTISGLIAMTYSWTAVELVVIRVLYPGLWLDARNLRSTAKNELKGEESHLAALQFLAVLIPLAGASLLVGVGPDQFSLTFRLLVTALLTAGIAGLGLTILAAGELRRTIAALAGRSSPRG